MTFVLFNKLLQNRLALFGFVLILIFIVLSIFGKYIASDQSENANQQCLAIKLKHPGFKIQFLGDVPVSDSFFIDQGLFHYQRYGFKEWNTTRDISLISKTYYLGTDGLGRDVLSRLIVGARVSLVVGLISVLISLVIGCVAGALSGYFGGWVDRLILWLINVFWAIPTILLAMVLLMGFKGKNSFQIFIVFVAVGLTMWVDSARLMRGLFLQFKSRQFVQSAQALGFSDFRIMFKHIFPNTFESLLVITSANFASAILTESGLSYLGLGVQPPTPSWGSMLREYYGYLGTELSYLALFPGFCIVLVVFAFYTLSSFLSDQLQKR